MLPTIEIDTNMAKAQNLQLNSGLEVQIIQIKETLARTQQKLMQDHLAIPPYCINNSTVAASCIERFHHDLTTGKITSQMLDKYASQYQAEDYKRGLNIYLAQQNIEVLPQIAIDMMGKKQNLQKIIYWGDKLSKKAVVSIIIYYIADQYT